MPLDATCFLDCNDGYEPPAGFVPEHTCTEQGIEPPYIACVDTDECADATSCSAGRACQNNIGSYYCSPLVVSDSLQVVDASTPTQPTADGNGVIILAPSAGVGVSVLLDYPADLDLTPTDRVFLRIQIGATGEFNPILFCDPETATVDAPATAGGTTARATCTLPVGLNGGPFTIVAGACFECVHACAFYTQCVQCSQSN